MRMDVAGSRRGRRPRPRDVHVDDHYYEKAGVGAMFVSRRFQNDAVPTSRNVFRCPIEQLDRRMFVQASELCESCGSAARPEHSPQARRSRRHRNDERARRLPSPSVVAHAGRPRAAIPVSNRPNKRQSCDACCRPERLPCASLGALTLRARSNGGFAQCGVVFCQPALGTQCSFCKVQEQLRSARGASCTHDALQRHPPALQLAHVNRFCAMLTCGSDARAERSLLCM
jgi:hypothetical protein